MSNHNFGLGRHFMSSINFQAPYQPQVQNFIKIVTADKQINQFHSLIL